MECLNQCSAVLEHRMRHVLYTSVEKPYHNDPKFRTDRSGQTEQSDQGLHCLQFGLHLLGALLFGKAILFKF